MRSCRAVTCFVALLAMACGGQPLPSHYVRLTTIGVNDQQGFESMRFGSDEERRRSIGFAHDVLALAHAADSRGHHAAALEHCEDVITAASGAFASRPAREQLRSAAWVLEARIYRSRGYQGRTLIAALLAGLATEYLGSQLASDDRQAFDEALEALDAEVRARNEAQQASSMAVFNAVVATTAAVTTTVTTQMRMQQSGQAPSQEAQESARRSIEQSQRSATRAILAASRAQNAVARADVRLGQQLDTFEEDVSLQTESIRSMGTRLGAAARFYIEVADADPRYVRGLAARVREHAGFVPAGPRAEIVATLDAACPAGAEACPLTEDAESALNLLFLYAQRERRR